MKFNPTIATDASKDGLNNLYTDELRTVFKNGELYNEVNFNDIKIY